MLVDFGSSFKFDELIAVSDTTPEYLAPEMLTFLFNIQKKKDDRAEMAKKLYSICKPWSFDVWSLATVIVEILTGYPVWMQLKCKMRTASGAPKVGSGIFGNKNRELSKILDLQTKFMKNMKLNLKKYDCYNMTKQDELLDLLS